MSAENAVTTTSTSVAVDIAKEPEKAAKPTKKVLIGLGIFCATCTGGIVGGLTGGLAPKKAQGTWFSNWGSAITVTPDYWYSSSSWGASVYKITTLTNDYVVMQNPADDAYNPSKWSRVQYHGTDDGWAYCTSVYDAETADDALKKDTTAVYDSSNADKGCNGFPHTLVTKLDLAIEGSWTTNWNEALTVSSTEWHIKSDTYESKYKVEAWGKDFILMQNPKDDSYNPSKWSKVQFHKKGDGFGYCISVYDASTAAAALKKDTSSLYDAKDDAKGCNGFGHSVVTKA